MSIARAPSRAGGGLLATERRRLERGRGLSLWLPLTPLLWLLAPIALVLAPFVSLNPALRRLGPFRALRLVGATLLSLSGTAVDIQGRRAHVRIRIF